MEATLPVLLLMKTERCRRETNAQGRRDKTLTLNKNKEREKKAEHQPWDDGGGDKLILLFTRSARLRGMDVLHKQLRVLQRLRGRGFDVGARAVAVHVNLADVRPLPEPTHRIDQNLSRGRKDMRR